jgi:hypothetical protein
MDPSGMPRESAFGTRMTHHCVIAMQGVDRHRHEHVCEATFCAMTIRPTAEQINEALTLAAWAAGDRTRYTDRIAQFLRGVDDCTLGKDGWFHIGWIGVVREPEEWDVLYDPVTEEGRLRSKRSGP